MATFTQPGSRADVLLAFARLALPDALRRSEPGLVTALLLGSVSFLVATGVTLGVLPAIFAIESDALRRNLLSLIACSVMALALLAQVTLRAPFTWLLDLERFLQLPVSFRDLYRLRLALSTLGNWLPFLGPAAAWLVATRSGGIAGVPVILLGLLSLVWLFGRLAAILSLLTDRWVEGWPGTLALMAVLAVYLSTVLLGLGALLGRFDLEGVARMIEDSAELGALGYTPPGLVVGIADEPGWSATNLARLGSLLALLALLTLLEQRLLLRDYLEHPDGDGRVAAGTLPLGRILRGSRRLTPMGALSLLEAECLLRLKSARRSLAAVFAFFLVASLVLGGPAAGIVTLGAGLLHSFRVEKQPSTSHVWSESLGLPLTIFRIFRASSRASSCLVAFLVPLFLGLMWLNWFGWQFFLVAVPLNLAGILLGTAALGFVQVHWPQRTAGPTADPNIARSAASFLASGSMAFPVAFVPLLYVLHRRELLGTVASGLIALGVLLVAAAGAYVLRQRQAQVLDARWRELLLEDPPASRISRPNNTDAERNAPAANPGRAEEANRRGPTKKTGSNRPSL